MANNHTIDDKGFDDIKKVVDKVIKEEKNNPKPTIDGGIFTSKEPIYNPDGTEIKPKDDDDNSITMGTTNVQ